MNPSKAGQLPYTYIAMTNFVCENCIDKWCRVTTMLGTSELNKVTGWLCEILPTGQSRVLTKCSAVMGPSAQKPMSDPVTNVVFMRQAKKQSNNPNNDLAMPDATTAWKEARAAQLLLKDTTRNMCLTNTTVKCVVASCHCCNWVNAHMSLASSCLRKQEICLASWLPQWWACVMFLPTIQQPASSNRDVWNVNQGALRGQGLQ